MVSHRSFQSADSLRGCERALVSRFPHPIPHEKFSQILNERKLLVSPSGRHIAQMRNAHQSEDHLDVVYQNRRTCTFLANAILLWVTPSQVLMWGRSKHDRVSGVYQLDGRGTRLLQQLDRLERIIRTPCGPMLKGANESDASDLRRYILPQGRGYILAHRHISAPCLHTNGSISIIEEKYGCLWHSVWRPDGSIEDIRAFSTQNHVRVLPWYREKEEGDGLQEGFAYLIDQGEQSVFKAVWQDPDWSEYEIVPGRIEHFWSTPTQKHVFILVQRPERGYLGCAHRQLYLDGELVEYADGYFEMGPEDLRWSPDESQYVARIRLHGLNPDGRECFRNRLITSMGEVVDAPADYELQDMAVDDHGQVMFYVLSDGQMHYPFYYGQPLEPATFIWNLHNFKKRFSGNRLVKSDIEQFRLPRRA